MERDLVRVRAICDGHIARRRIRLLEQGVRLFGGLAQPLEKVGRAHALIRRGHHGRKVRDYDIGAGAVRHAAPATVVVFQTVLAALGVVERTRRVYETALGAVARRLRRLGVASYEVGDLLAEELLLRLLDDVVSECDRAQDDGEQTHDEDDHDEFAVEFLVALVASAQEVHLGVDVHAQVKVVDALFFVEHGM